MEATSVRCLINSISRFILQVSCQTKKPTPIQKDYKNMVTVLKHLKPVLDEIVDYRTPSDTILHRECEELDLYVNEARELMEKWHPNMSKIITVWRCERLFRKIRTSSLQICQTSNKLLRSSSSISGLSSIQELQNLESEMIIKHIEEAVRSKRDDNVAFNNHITKIIESLSLGSEKEFLKESIAVEKERMDSRIGKTKPESDQIDQIIDLLSSIRSCLLKIECFEPKTGAPIPSYFRCPLSLQLMLDPVIVASGQTFERTSIQKWLDNRLTTCPKTRQTLAHTNLIPNFTVKAMIANWCEDNHLKLPEQNNPTSDPAAESNLSGQIVNSTSEFETRNGSVESNLSGKIVSSTSEFETQNGFVESNGFEIRQAENFESQSHELLYSHSRTESTASAVSSIDYVSPVSNSISTNPEFSGNPDQISKAKEEGNSNEPISSVDLADSNDLTTRVNNLVNNLRSQSNPLQTAAAAELRNLSKNKMENRLIIGQSGATVPLLQLLYSDSKLTQEHAVTALLNLSISEEVKALIAEAGAIEPLIHVLKSGNDAAKENSAAALFSLSVLDDYKAKIGRSGAVKALVNLLASGTLRGKKDAATALFNLSILHENKARIVQAGAVKYLVELLDPGTSMVDKAVALLANLSTVGEGRAAIVRAGGVPLLVEIVESGSLRGKENAASVLLQLCLNSPKFCTLVLQEGAVPPLVALSQSGTTRAKEKAQQLLSHFRSQREASMGKKSK